MLNLNKVIATAVCITFSSLSGGYAMEGFDKIEEELDRCLIPQKIYGDDLQNIKNNKGKHDAFGKTYMVWALNEEKELDVLGACPFLDQPNILECSAALVFHSTHTTIECKVEKDKKVEPKDVGAFFEDYQNVQAETKFKLPVGCSVGANNPLLDLDPEVKKVLYPSPMKKPY